MVAFSAPNTTDDCFIDEGMSASPMGQVRVCFSVDTEGLEEGQMVVACGSAEELGKWDPQRGLVLERDEQKRSRFRGHIMTSSALVKFRYFIGYKLSALKADRLIIDRWETFLQPRSILVAAEQRNGVCRAVHVDLFGYYAGQRLVSEGWLQYEDENQILLRLHGDALKFYKSTNDRSNCRVLVTPMDVRRKQPACSSFDDDEPEEEEEDDGSAALGPYPSHSACEVAVLSNANPRFSRQCQTGVVFNNNKDYVVFRTHSVADEFLAFHIEIFSSEGKRIGACFALPSSLTDTFGLTHLPFINSSGRPIGQISVEYLFVRSICRRCPFQSMEVSYSRHWKKRNTLEVGHRGAGNSYTKFAMARENTIHSLNTAARNGADYVEFDVQLTKDKVAVIYHDFHVLVSVAKRGGGAPAPSDSAPIRDADAVDFHEMAVKDLKHSQLKLDHVSLKSRESGRGQNGRSQSAECEEDDLKPFPPLMEALTKVDPDVGFNVEVKYPMMQTNGEHECSHYFERNEFVDVILSEILSHAGSRRIVFSSFDPDICSLIKLKQNRYPVLFLCIGETQRYTPFTDQRSSTSLTAVNFAAGADLLGVNFNSEDLLQDPYPVKRASEFGLVSFVWGDDLDKKETINYFKKELGLDGLIYDRIGEEERRQNVFIVEREQKKALFLVSSGYNTPRTCPSPVDSVNSSAASSTSDKVTSPSKCDHRNPGMDFRNLSIQPPLVEISQS